MGGDEVGAGFGGEVLAEGSVEGGWFICVFVAFMVLV